MRRLSVALPVVLAASRCQSAPAAANPKGQALQKILTGDVQFKNKAPLKEAVVELQFGANWKKDLESYANTLSAADKKTVLRQAARLNYTRYTTREIAQWGGEVESIDAVATAANLQEGVGYLQAKGESEFTAYVKAEAANANWSDERANKFIADVKAAAKASK